MESVRQKSGSCICISDRERVEGWTEEKVRQLLDAYLLEHSDLNLELQQAEIYINDNERLLRAALSGAIDCILVKNFSHFCEDAEKLSYYLETLFPKLNIRFLSVEDEYDSQRMEDRERLGAKMLELERAEYAKEQSRRILAAKKKASLPSKVPYGYLRSEKTQSLLVDEETAPYVRMIFQWALLGVSRRGIAERLNLLRLATPGQRQESGRLKVSFSETKWTIGAVQKILSNPTYSGDLATGRLRQSLYEGIRQYATKPSEWIIQKQSHEPMVAGDDWEEWSKRQK